MSLHTGVPANERLKATIHRLFGSNEEVGSPIDVVFMAELLRLHYPEFDSEYMEKVVAYEAEQSGREVVWKRTNTGTRTLPI